MEEIRIPRPALEAFCSGVFSSLGLSDDQAVTCARVLVSADACGIPSHGVARLGRYVNGLETGLMAARADFLDVRESSTSLVVDAQGGMGPVVSVQTMGRLVEKARTSGMAFGSVRNSNHFGIAAYYAKMALPAGMIGIAMTNTAALGVPTFGRDALFGTNPLAFAAPADKEVAFVLDMSTTVVTRGKIEVFGREAKELPDGWAVDPQGQVLRSPAVLLENLQQRVGGGILPLGGHGTESGGHKGFGLAVLVDILCAVLAGDAFGPQVADTATSSARVSHFFGAIDISRFRDLDAFRADMDRMLGDLRAATPAEGQPRVYYAGLPEREFEHQSDRRGVPLSATTHRALEDLGRRFGVRLA